MTDKNKLPRVFGVSRDFESPGGKGVLLSFERALTDDELRTLHDSLAPPAPASVQDGQGGLTGTAEAIVDYVYQHVGFKERDALVSEVCAILARQPAPVISNAEAATWCRENSLNVPAHWESAPVQGSVVQGGSYSYASTQATTCAGCGEHKHTPLRIDAMGGYVCLTCIDQKLGSLLGEFGYAAPQAQAEREKNGLRLLPRGVFVSDEAYNNYINEYSATTVSNMLPTDCLKCEGRGSYAVLESGSVVNDTCSQCSGAGKVRLAASRAAVPKGWKRATGEAAKGGWTWDYDWLESLREQLGGEVGLEQIDNLLTILSPVAQEGKAVDGVRGPLPMCETCDDPAKVLADGSLAPCQACDDFAAQQTSAQVDAKGGEQ